MVNNTIDQIKVKAVPILMRAGVTRSSIYGSYVRGEQKQESDIDLLVDVPRGTSLFDLADLQIKLEEALGKNVDLVTYASVHHLLKDRIMAEQIGIL
ncbi:MAG: nucleotidyltransferase family protein [Patescibacteria group bacterium]